VQNPGNTAVPDPAFYIENTASSGSVLLSELTVLYFLQPEGGVSGVQLYERIDTASTALSGQIIRVGYTTPSNEAVAAGNRLKSAFGYHAANWNGQNIGNDYSQQSCSSSGTNSRMVLCRKIDGQQYQVWGTLPSYDTQGCERP